MVSVDASTSVLAMTVSFGMVWNMPYSRNTYFYSRTAYPCFRNTYTRLWSQRQLSQSAWAPLPHMTDCTVGTCRCTRAPLLARRRIRRGETKRGRAQVLCWLFGGLFPSEFASKWLLWLCGYVHRKHAAPHARVHAPVASCISHLPHLPGTKSRAPPQLSAAPFDSVRAACVCVFVCACACACVCGLFVQLLVLLIAHVHPAQAVPRGVGKALPQRQAQEGHLRQCVTPAPGLGSTLPHLHRDWAHPCHIGTRTRLALSTSALGLGPPLPPRHRD